MIKLFEKSDGFGTMAAERDRSISSNCHVLLALLAWSDYPRYGSQIRKAANFMCEYWWNCNGRFKDKWVSRSRCRLLVCVVVLTRLAALEPSLPDDVDGQRIYPSAPRRRRGSCFRAPWARTEHQDIHRDFPSLHPYNDGAKHRWIMGRFARADRIRCNSSG